jgi:SAM-dependent methyltransferase
MIYSHYSKFMAQSMSIGRPGPEAGEMEHMRKYLDSCEQPFLELACGYGRMLLALLEKGYRIMGIDSSPEMLAQCRHLARKKRLRPVLQRQFMQELSLKEKFGLIFTADGDIALVITEADKREMLRRVYSHLKPGGTFMFDFYPPGMRSKDPARKTDTGWVEAPDGSVFVSRRDETFDPETGIQHNLQIHERYVSGKFKGSQAFKDPMKYDEPDYIRKLLTDAGFTDIVLTEYRSDKPATRDCGMASAVCRKPKDSPDDRSV